MAEEDHNDANQNDRSTCCNEPQTAFLYLYFIYAVIVLLTAELIIAKPLRLLATSIHELSHAAACWLTCGSVHQLQVYENEGGVTRYSGGWRCLVASAGYIGEAFWGLLLVVLSGGRISATIAAAALMTILMVGLCYSPNRVMVILNVTYTLILAIVLVVEWCYFSPIIQYVTLLFGVYLGMFAIMDIFSHLIVRSNPESDAYTIYEESGRCCPPRLVGTWWLLLAIVMQLSGLYVALILMCDQCQDMGWFECIFRSKMDLHVQEFDWWPDDWELRRDGDWKDWNVNWRWGGDDGP